MDVEDLNAVDRQTQRSIDKLAMAEWVHSLAPWTVLAHFTWRDKIFHYRDGTPKACGVKIDSARFLFERFMAEKYGRLSYFYAIEENPARDGHHIHALFADCKELYRKGMWEEWFKRFGRNKVERVASLDDVVSYCAKYVTKEGAWWNVKLQWHHRRALTDPVFKLSEVVHA